MKKYVAKRDELCLGSVIKPSRYDIDEFKTLSFSADMIRGILFRESYKTAEDLIWKNPVNYPLVEKQVSLEDLKRVLDTSRYVVEDYVELGDILKYLKYSEDLTKSDLHEIYHILITNPLFNERANAQLLQKLSGSLSCEEFSRITSIGKIGNGKPSYEETYTKIRKR